MISKCQAEDIMQIILQIWGLAILRCCPPSAEAIVALHFLYCDEVYGLKLRDCCVVLHIASCKFLHALSGVQRPCRF